MSTATNPAPKMQTPVGARLSATPPKPEDFGIDAAALLDQPRKVRYAVIAYDVARIIDDVDDGSRTAVIRLLKLETVPDNVAGEMSQAIAQYAKQRSNLVELDFGDTTDDD